MQDRLAEALALRQVRPIGAQAPVPGGCPRIIAASNWPLEEMVAAGISARICTKHSRDPHRHATLRERPGDIPALTRYFLHHIGEQPGLRPLASPMAPWRYWPLVTGRGNVRQLQATLPAPPCSAMATP